MEYLILDKSPLISDMHGTNMPSSCLNSLSLHWNCTDIGAWNDSWRTSSLGNSWKTGCRSSSESVAGIMADGILG